LLFVFGHAFEPGFVENTDVQVIAQGLHTFIKVLLKFLRVLQKLVNLSLGALTPGHLVGSLDHPVIDIVHQRVQLMDHLRGDLTKEHFIVISDLKVHALALWKVSEEVASLLAESVFFAHVKNDLVFVVHGFEGLLHKALLLLLVEKEQLGWGNAV
jgi:hypothetical protein